MQPTDRHVAIKRRAIDEQTGCAIMRALAEEIAHSLETSPHRSLPRPPKVSELALLF